LRSYPFEKFDLSLIQVIKPKCKIMKKKWLYPGYRPAVFEMLKKMKLTIFLICISVFGSYAVESYAQTARLSLDVENVTIKTILSKIENQSEFKFFYSSNVDVEQTASISEKNKKVFDILDELFKGTGIKYEVYGRQIALLENGESYTFPEEEMTAQQKSISGTVTDNTGQPLPGVTVVVKGSTQGTVTNADGKYSITNIPDNATLQFSFVGMRTQEIVVGNQTSINVTLEVDAIGIEEVVAVGYGTMRKSDVTGTVSTVDEKQLRETPAVNFAEAMAGQVAGVQIQQTNGAPGGENIMVRVRGASSITAGNAPLYVIDGYPMEQGDLNMLNPNDIQSIEILKDASASAIYGSRGGNGVVLITTKSGGKRKGQNIELNINAGIQQVAHRPEMMNSTEYAQWFIDGHNNAWLQADPNNKITDPNSVRESSYYIIPEEMYHPENLPDTNWGDVIFRNALIQNYQINVSNNNEKGHSLIGGSYVDQVGTVKGTDFKKYNLHSNFFSNVTDKLSFGGNLDASYNFTHLVEDGKYGPVELSLVVPPIYPVYNEDGSYGCPLNSSLWTGDDPSPLETALENDWYEKQYRTLGKMFGEYQLTPALRYRVSVGGVMRINKEFRYRPSYMNRDSRPAPNLADGEETASYGFNWLFENLLNYEKKFGEDHHLMGLLGYTVQKNNMEESNIYATNYPNDVVHTLNAGQVTDGYTRTSQHSLISYLARVNYFYKNKYLITVSARADGSSRFGTNNKWGFFPSGSFGWRMSEEDFMKDVKFISNQKLRVSYGYTGNYSIPNYGSIGLLGNGYYVLGTGNGALVNAVTPSTMPNPDLGWEKTQQLNLGMDLGLFDNKIYLEADYYSSLTRDLLLNVPVPRITGYGSQLQNIGKVRNRGFELMVSTHNTAGAFKWNTDFNISFNKNKVIALGPENKPIYASAPNASNSFITEVGKPISNLFGYIFDGVYMSQEQINNHAHLDTDVVGDPIIRDVNGDKKINSADRAVLGNNQPDFIFGLTNSFSYNNFDLKILLTGVYGNEVLTLSSRFTKFYHGDRNGRKEMVNRWRSPEQPGNGELFMANRLYQGLQKQPSSYWVQDGSYLRIKDVNLGYNFNADILNNIGISSAKIYFSISNLYTFTNYWGFDPEVSTTGTGLSKGGDYSGYPISRTFLLGINVNF